MKKILTFSQKEFGELFFEFQQKKFNPDLLLTREEFYNHTSRIAIFSDRLATLYPKEKEVVEAYKVKW